MPQNPIPTQITITGPDGSVQTITQDPSAPLPAQGAFIGAAVGGAEITATRPTVPGGAGLGVGSTQGTVDASGLVTQASLDSGSLTSGPDRARLIVLALLAVAALTGGIYAYTRWYDAHR